MPYNEGALSFCHSHGTENRSQENCQLKAGEALLWCQGAQKDRSSSSTKLPGVGKLFQSAKMKSFPQVVWIYLTCAAHREVLGKGKECSANLIGGWTVRVGSLHSPEFPRTLASRERSKAFRALTCFYHEETLPVDCNLATASCLFPKLGQNSGWKLDLESGRILIGPAKKGKFSSQPCCSKHKSLTGTLQANHCLLPDRDKCTSV